jgi:hypothetical protein
MAGPTQPRSLLFTLMQFHNQLTWKAILVHALHTWNEKHQQLWNQRKVVAVSWLWMTHTYPLNKCNECNVVQCPMQVVHQFGHASIDGHCPSYILGKAKKIWHPAWVTLFLTFPLCIWLILYPLFVLHFIFLDTCFSQASFHPFSFQDLSFFFFFPFFKEAQQQTRPTSHWHSQVKHSGRGWLAGLSPGHHTSQGLNFEPRIFYFLRSHGPRLQGAIPLSHW